MSRARIVAACVALMLGGCKKPPPPAPTVALAEAARPGVELRRGDQVISLAGERRVEDGTEVVTPAGGRASLRLDGGTWVLLDQSARLRVSGNKIELSAGRAWVDAREVETLTVAVPGGTLTATQSGFAVETDGKTSRVYCVAGQLTYAARESNRLESGMSVRIGAGGETKEEPEAQWDDWTGGLAEPGPPRAPEPAAVGQLAGRTGGEEGQAASPLIIRRHDVKTTIRRDLAVTDVEQVFFNPRSEILDGIYTLRLPPGAIVAGFEVLEEGAPSFLWSTPLGQWIQKVVPPARPNEPVSGISLQWAGGDRFRAAVPGLAPGKTRTVHIRYVEWLTHHEGRRTWTYPMGGQAPPLLGEFSLEVDSSDAGAGSIEAGMDAIVEGSKVVLRRSDFRPRADFALDLLDGKEAPKGAASYFAPVQDEVARGYLLVPLDLPFPKAPATLDLVLVVDTSAATDPGRLDLARAVVDAVLRQLTPGDRVAVVAASTDVKPLGTGEPLAPVSRERAEQLLDALAHEPATGATDLGRALERAAELAGPTGAVVYIGDGQPTVGALLPGDLRERLSRLGHPPRLFTVAIGGDGRQDAVSSLASGGGLALRVEDRPDAAHAAYRLLAAAAQPVLRDLRFDFGAGVDVVYPGGPVHVVAGQPLLVAGRMRGEPPRKIHVTGRRAGEAFELDLPLAPQAADEGGDVRRRWAAGRLADLLDRGAGREALIEIGTRFGLVTPFSAIVTQGDFFAPLEGAEPVELFAPFASRDLPPEDATIALPAGATSTARARGDLDRLYARAVTARDESVRACFDRRAASRPGLSGRVVFALKIGLGGEVQAPRLLSTTLRDAQTEACMTRAIAALRLPPPPDGKVHEITQAFLFEQDDGRLAGESRCSTASRQYLQARRALWRERFGRAQSGAEGAMSVWREAERKCELRTWLDKKALLDILRRGVGTTLYQVDLYQRFAEQPDVQAYLRREILRAVRTAEDVRAVRGGLDLDGGVAQELLDAQLAKAPSPEARLRVVRQFVALAPDGIALRVRLLQALEEAAGAPGADRTSLVEEARRVALALRADPAADLGARQAIGELYARLKDLDEAARTFSEIVEFAPFDPWARRRLGDLFLAYGRHEDAAREYRTLAWLTPTDPRVLLLLARASAGAGRTDEALRLWERLAETVEVQGRGGDAAGWARAFISLQLAGLREAARKASDAPLLARLAARGRADGIHAFAGEALVAVTWPHPDARLELSIAAPGDTVARRAEVQGGEAGLEALRLAQQARGVHTIRVRRPPAAGDRVRVFDGELVVVFGEGNEGEKVQRFPVRLPPEVAEATFKLDGRTIEAGPLVPAPPPAAKPGKAAAPARPRRGR